MPGHAFRPSNACLCMSERAWLPPGTRSIHHRLHQAANQSGPAPVPGSNGREWQVTCAPLMAVLSTSAAFSSTGSALKHRLEFQCTSMMEPQAHNARHVPDWEKQSSCRRG